ncbi:MAG TPA: DNA-formamidopyrimidine glycosylase family protein, partial [Ilumatobacteraceae bacterium]|nr:DNA-formamidopyrimidine glycosylase family protein [Ilumatobacteraceae bacterium]
MAEGDTIRRIADKVLARLVGQRCVGTTTRDPRLVGTDFTGRTLVSADAVGKHLFLRFDDGRSLHAHLLMTGNIVVGPAAPVAPSRRRIEIDFEPGRFTGVDVPLLDVIQTADEPSLIGHLGPDLCGPNPPDIVEITRRLAHDPAVPLAEAMLDQRNVAGFGNVYAVEVPFIVGISPLQPAGTI